MPIENQRPVHTLMSKQFRVVVHCPTCPISPDKFGGNQKSACVHLMRQGNREERRNGKVLRLKKEKQCEWYKKDSIKKLENGLNVITCIYN